MTTSAIPPARVVLIGCGAVVRLFYAPALAELQRCGIVQVSALVDPSADSRHALAKAFPRAELCESLEAAFVSGGTLAIVASPPKFHCQHTTTALEAGLDVLCEKPMASSVQDCETMIESARRLGRILAVGHYKRFFPVHRAIKHFILNKPFGALESVTIAEGGKFAWPAVSDSFFRKDQTPGGVLLDIGVHVLDLLIWWLDEPTEFSYSDDVLDGLEANALLNASFAHGITATVQLSRDWETSNTYAFRFRRAMVHVRVNRANQAEITFNGLPMTFAADLREEVNADFPSPTLPLDTNPQAFASQLVDVVTSIREGRAPFVAGAEGVRAIRWIEQCYRRREPLRTPWIQQSRTNDTCVSQ